MHFIIKNKQTINKFFPVVVKIQIKKKLQVLANERNRLKYG